MSGFQHIGRYKVLSELGRGGMGVVYLAEDTNLGRSVAIKVLPGAKKESQNQLRDRFLREARVSARLDNPYVIHLHDVGQEDGTDYIVMEYVRGRTLRDEIEDHTESSPIPADEVARLFWEICQGVEYAHRMHVIHRDLKPENIMVTDEKHIKIMDFGLAWQDEQARLTRDGAIMGTVAYFSPEQARGERADERSDIYSLGAILFEMLTCRLVFEAQSPGEMIAHQLNTPAPSPRRYVASVPDALERIVLKCLEKAPADRYPIVGDILADLEGHLAHRRISFAQLRAGTERRPSVEEGTRVELPVDVPIKPGAYWNPPPVPDLDHQPWMDLLQQLPSRRRDDAKAPAADLPQLRPVVVPPIVNPWEIVPHTPDGSPAPIASESWLKEAEANAGWGKFDNVISRLRKEDPLRSVSKVDAEDIAPDTMECKRCHTFNPVDRKYCMECAGLLVQSNQRLQQEARELAELGIMYYKQGQLPDARREFDMALERTPGLFEARLFLGRIELDEHNLELAEQQFRLAISANDQDARPLALLADIYNEQGRKEEAVRTYRTALTVEPQNGETRCRLAFLLSSMGQVAESVAEYRTVVDTDPDHVDAYEQLGIIYAGQDMIDESIAAFEAVTKLDGQNHQAFRWLARLYARRNRYGPAERAYQTAISLAPEDADLYAQLGSLYEVQKKEDAAVKVLQKAIALDVGNLEARTRIASLYLKHNQTRMAIEELEQAAIYNPSSATLHRQLGELYLADNNLDRALEHFEQAVMLNPKAAEAHSQLGRLYLRKDCDAGAVQQYQHAISIEPYNAVYREELGMAYFAQNRKDLAILELRKAAMLDNSNVEYHKALGYICEDADRLDEAVQALQKALELAPRDALAHGLMGKVYLKQGLAHFAIRELQKAVETDPSNLLLQIYVARAYSQAGQPQLAIKHFRQAIELGGTERRETRKFMAQSYQDLARAYLDSGQYRKAAEVLDASLSVLPDHPRSLHYRGLAALGMGDTRKARELIYKASAMEPQNPEVYYSLGKLHDKLNDPNQALRSYRQACKLAPNRVEFLEALSQSLSGQKLYSEACNILEVAVKLRPARAGAYHGMMGTWLLEQGQLGDAVEELLKAVNKGSDEVQHYLSAARALAQAGRVQDAKQVLKNSGTRFTNADDRTALEEALKRLKQA